MSNILFLTSVYSGKADANGICTRNVIRQIEKMGHRVTVLSYYSDCNEPNVHIISSRKAGTNYSTITKIAKAASGLFCPVIDGSVKKQFQEKTLLLCKDKAIDTVVYVFFPIETLTIMKKVKQCFPKIKNVVYELDSVGDGLFGAAKRNRLATVGYEHWMSGCYHFADKIIIMQSHDKYWNRVFGKKHGHKMHLADIPVLTKREGSIVPISDDNQITLLYGGMLDLNYRSPSHMLEVFDACSKKENLAIEFFTKGNCEKMISEHSANNANIHQNGYVPEDVLNKAINNADILMSIGNKVSRSVPSKLIAYLSYGKPVVHFASQKDDVCAEYLTRYPLGLVLYEWDTVETNEQKLLSFIKKVYGATLSFDEVERILRLNTPAHSAELIV